MGVPEVKATMEEEREEEEERMEEIRELEEVLTALEELEVGVLLAELLLVVVVLVLLELEQVKPNQVHMRLMLRRSRSRLVRLAAVAEAGRVEAARAEFPVMLAVATVVTSAAMEEAIAEVLIATVWTAIPFKTGSVWTIGAAAIASKSSC